jgi:hypothetical protein
LYTVTSNPAWSNRVAIAEPILPKPMKPTVGAVVVMGAARSVSQPDRGDFPI